MAERRPTTGAEKQGLLALLRAPGQGLIAQGIILVMLSGLALLLRLQLDLDGVRDVDTLNFGLAAWDFNPIEQRPHSPGYLGYVLYLKAFHALAPGLDAASLAKWGSRCLGVLCVPSAWWVCHVLLSRGKTQPTQALAAVRPLTAAALVLTQPLLWYYSSDGQSHASEALATLLLFGGAVICRRAGRTRDLLRLACAFGIAGSLRPTIPLLCSPLLLWVLWGHPIRSWILAGLAGLAGTLLWYIPTVELSGGFESYQRAADALIYSLILQNFSFFGEHSAPVFLAVNANISSWGLGLALLLLPGWIWTAGDDVAWRRAVLPVLLLSGTFYGLIHAAESGYFTGLAALSVLAPATWPRGAEKAKRAIALTLVGATLGASFVLFGPAETPVLGAGSGARIAQPTFRNLWRWEAISQSYRAATCDPATEGHSVVITDSSHSELQRDLSLRCDISVVRWLAPNELQAEADGLLIYRGIRLIALPTGIPFETGPPATYRFEEPVRRILVSPAASPQVADTLRAQQHCPPLPRQPPDGSSAASLALAWEASCLPEIRLGSHQLLFTSPERPDEQPQ